MAKIPYTPYPTRESADLPTPSIRLNVPDVSGVWGRALQQVSHGFDRLAEGMYQIQNFEDEKTVDKAVTENFMESDAKINNYLENQNGDKAKEALPDLYKDLQESREKRSEGMTPNQKKMFDNKTLGNMRVQMGKSATHAASESKKSAID